MFEGVRISIDYAKAILQAKKLESIAEECSENIQQIDKQIASLEGVWEGEASRAYIEKLNEYKTENQKIQNDIKNVAKSIREVARIIKEADEAAAANTPSGGGSGGGRF